MSFRCENNHLLVSPGECEICLLRARVEAFKAKLAEARSGGCFCDRSHPELADSHLDTCPKFLLKLDARRAALTKKLAARLAEVEREASYHSHHSIEKGNCLTCAQWMDTESSLAKMREALEEAHTIIFSRLVARENPDFGAQAWVEKVRALALPHPTPKPDGEKR